MLVCEAPNTELYKFEGKIQIVSEENNIEMGGVREAIPLGPDNVILRGSSLRNTEYIYGIIVYTGHDTKVMRNSSSAKYKFSKLELLANVCIIVILGF